MTIPPRFLNEKVVTSNLQFVQHKIRYIVNFIYSKLINVKPFVIRLYFIIFSLNIVP